MIRPVFGLWVDAVFAIRSQVVLSWTQACSLEKKRRKCAGLLGFGNVFVMPTAP